jgi:thiamine-phosphate pyrophosphorylase
MFDIRTARLCLVTDRPLSRGRPLTDIVAAAVRGGATMVQLREKDAGTREFLEQASALKALLKSLGIPLVLNDRVDIALAVDADGIHVGQSDMPIADVRRLVGERMFIGLSASKAEFILAPDAQAADYLGVGPVYAQTTKPGTAGPHGPEGFGKLRALTKKPVMAIGGIKASNAAPVIAAGADGLAVVSAIVAADDPEKATREIAALWR